jgi:hypothetical protein
MLDSTISFQNLFQRLFAMRFKCTLPILACFVLGFIGCERVDPIVTYTVPTKLPAQLVPGQDRMLAAMLPKGKNIWFFKVTGPENAVDSIRADFRNFVEGIKFEDGSPELADLPAGWRRGGEKPFRYATLDVETPDKQLGISVSSLPLREDSWDQQVQDNVNRWRGQLGLPKSDQKWADAQTLTVKDADPNSVWVDIVGETGGTNSMAPPFANRVPPPSPSGKLPAMPPLASAASVADEQMLAAMVPMGSDVWFFKVKGAKESVASLLGTFRSFVEGIQFEQGVPELDDLPTTWTRGGERPFRYATLDVATPSGKLDISISKLRQQDKPWAEQVVMNVNRWRGQMGLQASTKKWAGGQPLSVKAADEGSVWVNLSGDDGRSIKKQPVAPPVTSKPKAGDTDTGNEDAPVSYDRPKGWRDGRMSSMRLAAFNVGPEDKSAEITVIPAGGDLRGNVARWLGQVRKGTAPDQVVDQALKDAQDVTVAGVAGKRFLLIGEKSDAADRMAIDATIIPLGSDGTSSLFVKMTGPAETVEKQADEIALFLKSLKLNL